MELGDLKRAAAAAREFTHTVELDSTKIVFTLRVPTPFEAECAAAGNGLTRWRSTSEAVVRSQRALTELAIVGWQGAFVRDVLPGHKHGDDELPFDPAAIPLLLDERRDIAELVWLPVVERLEALQRERGATAKNSQRASPGARAKPVRASSKARD